MEETQLARTPAVIRTADEFRASLERWQGQRFNVLTPFSNISGLAPSHGILTSVVQINTDKTAGDVYDGLPFLKGGDVALAKNGLRRIAEGLGISTQLQYISVGIIPHYWHVKAIGSYRGIDGRWVQREASQEWDLRDGSDRLKGWQPQQISEARKHGLRACETRAVNAVIRECGCGIKQSYKKEELARPFVAVRVMLDPDMSDPEVRRMVTAAALGGVQALYPAPVPTMTQPAIAAPHDAFDEDDDDEEPRAVGRSSSPGAQQGSPAPAVSSTPSAPGLLVTDINEKSGSHQGRPWTVWQVNFSDGRQASTFNRDIAQLAVRARQEQRPVDALISVTEKGPKLDELAFVASGNSDDPGLPFPDAGKL